MQSHLLLLSLIHLYALPLQGHVQFSMGFLHMWLVCSLVGSNSWQLSRLLVVVVGSSYGFVVLWFFGDIWLVWSVVGSNSWQL